MWFFRGNSNKVREQVALNRKFVPYRDNASQSAEVTAAKNIGHPTPEGTITQLGKMDHV